MSFTKYRNIGKSKNTGPIDPALLAEVRAYLSMRYERRLKNKLAGRLPVNLKTVPSTTGTSEESASTYMTFSEDQVKGAIGDIYLRSNGRMLLLGAPGAGKTTLVLQLALFLLERQGISMPVVLNLATWRAKFATFENWLSEILPAELAVSISFAKKIQSSIPLILLLDGLDEVPEADRATCIESIGEYGSNAQHQFLISSRIDEYSATKDAPVNAQIQVEQLTIDQVEKALMATAHLQPESTRLLNALKTDPLLREAVENPFYLNTAQLLFSKGKNWSEFRFTASDVAGRQHEIMLFFIRDALQQKVITDYPTEKSERWLSFLASRMNQRNMVVFELTDLQYDWWKWSKWEIKIAESIRNLVVGLTFGVYIGFFLGLIAGLLNGPISGIVLGFLGGISMALIFLLIRGLLKSQTDILTIERVDWTTYTSKYLLPHVFIVVMVMTMLSSERSDLIDKVMLIGLLFLSFLVLFKRLINLLNENTSLIQITTPYQRFNISRNVFYFSIIQHKFLCFQLQKYSIVSDNIPQFLNEMSLRHIFEFDGDPATGKGGGSWRFRHRILQDYFAGKWVEPDHTGKN